MAGLRSFFRRLAFVDRSAKGSRIEPMEVHDLGDLCNNRATIRESTEISPGSPPSPAPPHLVPLRFPHCSAVFVVA